VLSNHENTKEMNSREQGKHGGRLRLRSRENVGELQARGVVGLTKVQMAAALQVCPRTIADMMRRGEISYFKIGSRLVRFRIEDALKRMGETVLIAAERGEQ
jgi:hypothetical protein